MRTGENFYKHGSFWCTYAFALPYFPVRRHDRFGHYPGRPITCPIFRTQGDTALKQTGWKLVRYLSQTGCANNSHAITSQRNLLSAWKVAAREAATMYESLNRLEGCCAADYLWEGISVSALWGNWVILNLVSYSRWLQRGFYLALGDNR